MSPTAATPLGNTSSKDYTIAPLTLSPSEEYAKAFRTKSGGDGQISCNINNSKPSTSSRQEQQLFSSTPNERVFYQGSITDVDPNIELTLAYKTARSPIGNKKQEDLWNDQKCLLANICRNLEEATTRIANVLETVKKSEEKLQQGFDVGNSFSYRASPILSREYPRGNSTAINQHQSTLLLPQGEKVDKNNINRVQQQLSAARMNRSAAASDATFDVKNEPLDKSRDVRRKQNRQHSKLTVVAASAPRMLGEETSDKTKTHKEKEMRRMVGEIAFQLERRVLQFIFGYPKSKRYYGYQVANIEQGVVKAATQYQTQIINHDKVAEYSGRLHTIMRCLANKGYDKNKHAPMCEDLINNYGLIKDKARKVENNRENIEKLQDAINCTVDKKEHAEVLLLLHCLVELSSLDGLPLFFP